MPPRGRGRGRGAGGPPAQRGGAPAIAVAAGGPPAAHVQTIGVRRPAPGTAGRRIQIATNHFAVDIQTGIIYHYDVVINADEKKLPVRMNMELIRRLQEVVVPAVFTPRAAYDGRKNMFAPQRLPLGDTDSAEFDVTLDDPTPVDSAAAAAAPKGEGGGRRGPKVYKIKLALVASINSENLARFLQGTQSHDNAVLTAITALNVVIRMQPSLTWPFNTRSFFTDRETRDVGGGVVLWRGYFQSIRPAVGRMLINVDISTAGMYKEGPLIGLCLAFLKSSSVNDLAPSSPRFNERERQRLTRFLANIRVNVRALQRVGGQGQVNRRPRVVRAITKAGANGTTFSRNGTNITVAKYYQTDYNHALRYPNIVCAEVGNKGDIIPLELCEVIPGQIIRKQPTPEVTKAFVEFSTKVPTERLASIQEALGVLAYGQSEYVRQFGLKVQPDAKPLSLQARVIDPPTLRYGANSKQPTITPRGGAWNLIDKKFIQPCSLERWVVVIYENENRFRMKIAKEMVGGLLSACNEVGIRVREQDPLIRYENAQGNILEQLRAAGAACNQKNKGFPNLIVVVIPDNADDLYRTIKHFGDITTGVATQCMKSNKCAHARPQYFANVCLKINVKLGGINTIPDPRSVSFLTDPHNPTIVMGADVMHPPPGADDRPSFASLVANVDSDNAKYIADLHVQAGRREMIRDLEAMSQRMLEMYMSYRKNAEKKSAAEPKRIIFYRDGVSEGEFQQVIDIELPRIRKACENLKIRPKITLIVVGKRHHVRFFPLNKNDADKSGNCPAGTVVDQEVVHPLEFDWLHADHSLISTILGTSRPAHYIVLHDDNNFTSDGLQALSYALCHVYARATRSVSIPAPVYYAHIVCSRAKIHYSPGGRLDLSETATIQEDAAATLQAFQQNFRPLHPNTTKTMYFS